MTISSTTNRAQFNCNGSTTSFPFTFKYVEASDLQVYLSSPAGVVTLLTLNVDYEIAPAVPGPGGTLSFLGTYLSSPPVSGYTLTILRFIARTQEVDFINGDSLDENNIEGMGDKLTMMVQDLDEKIGRAVQVPPSSALSNIALPAPEAGKFIRWKATLDGFENVAVADIGSQVINNFWAVVLAAAGSTLAEALAAMGLDPSLSTLTLPDNVTISAFAKTLLDDNDAAAARATLQIPTASETAAGIAELATQAETNAGTDDARIVTPKKLASYTGLRGMKNLLINGSMVIGQRAADQTLDQTPRYGRVDRWHAFWSSATGVTPGTQGHQNSVNTESYNVMVLTPLTCSATNSLLIGQRIESVNSRYLRFANDYGGVSFRIKVWHNFGVDVSMKCVVYTADATDNFSAITSRYTSGARVIPPGTFATLKFEGFNIGTADVEKGVVVYLKVDTPICSGATMYLGDAQLEIGPACTDLEKRQYGLELALCQRYYEKSYNYAIAPGAASSDGCVLELVSRNSSGTTYGAKFAVEKRAVPTVTCFSDQDGASGYCYNNGNKACAAGRIGTAGFSYASITSGDSANNASYHWVASIEL